MVNPGWELTITLPSSYWYLQGFDVSDLEKYVNWFNVMTYDIHGIWDQYNQWTGPYLKGHTNLTEIDQGLQLLWRNGVPSDKIVMGFGFYGRSFTMTDPNCYEPGCTFSGAGIAGDCSGTPGILTYAGKWKNFRIT
jgi:GH18 family chitinase